MQESKVKRFFNSLKGAWWPTWQNGTTSFGYGIERVYLNRRKLNLNDPQAWFDAYAQHELAYACINKIADVMNDAEIIVEKKAGDDWEAVPGHPLTQLLKHPNTYETGRDFRRLMVQSEYAAAITYTEIIRSRAGMPIEFYVLNPNRVTPRTKTDAQRDVAISRSSVGAAVIANEIVAYEYRRGDGTTYFIKPENMLVRRRVDLVNRFYGLSPLAVALKSINSDMALTDYVDAFFENDGTPSGILKLKNRKLSREEAADLQSQWKVKYSRGGFNHKGPAVLDEDGDYQPIGSNLQELDTQNISNRFESRICSVFGVPPILVGALVGLTHTTANATAKSALNDFWDNKVNPELAQLREWLTWFVLPLFEDIETIRSEKIRCGYDVSNAAFLQEDENATHQRIRDNFKAGLMMLNEAREAIGLMPDDSVKGTDYYVQPANVTVISAERRAEGAEEEPKVPVPLQLGEGDEQEIIEEEPIEEPKTLLPVLPVKERRPRATVPAPEIKRYELDGLMLGREPNHIEKLCDLKAIANEQQINRERAEKVLKMFRMKLIEQAVEKLDKRTPENAHALRLEPDAKTRKELAKAVRNAYATGQNQVARELLAQKRKVDATGLETKDLDDNDLQYIEELTDGLVSRLINEIKTRAINQYLALKLLANFTSDLLRQILLDQSEKYIADLAGSVINAAIQSGRADEANERQDEWDNVQYSAVLDVGTCGPCEEADGMEADDPKELPPAPNPDCEGGARCRCFHIWVAV